MFTKRPYNTGTKSVYFCLACFALTLIIGACQSPGERIRLIEENTELRRSNEELARRLARQEATIARLREQIGNLKGFSPDRPADLFAPVRIEIDRLTGGADYDGDPGDDGVTVYVQPRDVDGNVVKAPGRMSVQLLDNTNLAEPKTVGLCVIADPQELRLLWHGRFLAQHFVVKCPFEPGRTPPRRVTVRVEFVDYLTGRKLSAVREVKVSRPQK